MHKDSKSFERDITPMAVHFVDTEIVITTILFFLLLWLWHWYKNRSSQAFTNWPIVGMLPGILRCRSHFVEQLTNALIRSGDSFEFRGPCFSNFNFIVTSNPMDMNHMLCRKFDNYDKTPEFREIFLDAMGDGILNAASHSWKAQRKILMSLMHSSKFVRRTTKIIGQKLEKSLLAMLENFVECGAELDLQDVLHRFSYDNVCFSVLGFDPNSLSVEFPHVPSKEAFTQAEEVLLYRHLVPVSFWKLQKWLQIGEEKKMRKALEILDDFTYSCISSKQEILRTKSQANQEDEFDLLTAIMDEKEAEVSAIGKSDRVLRDILLNVLGAGKDAVTASLSWFFWLVATNPSVESKILEDIKANSPNAMMYYGEEELNGYIYLHAVICETLRLYPAVPLNHKVAIQPDILPSGHRVGKNARIILNFYAMGRMREIWGEDCLEFKPERWITKQGDIMHVPSYKFIAFNAGPRTCIGKELSFIQSKIIAIAILRKYKIEVVKQCSPSPANAIVGVMKHGLKVMVKRRAAY